MKEDYLAKWLNNDLSGEDLRAFRDSPGYETYRRIAEVSARLEGPGFDVEAALARAKEARQDGKGRIIRLSPYRHLWKIAAALVVLLGVSYFFYRNTLEEAVHTDFAQRSEVVLPDQSEVLLNAGSRLAYSDKKWDTRRHVSLEGEAFFRVAKGQTFTVETPSGTVTVLGTQFNVLQRGSIFMVACYEGLVRVDHNGTSLELPAGTGYRVVGGASGRFEVLAGGHPSWMDRESSFRSMPLSFVLQELERQYNIKVETRGVDAGITFTGTFSNTNLDLALQSISAPLQLRYTIQGDQVLVYAQNAP